jgi:diacylglycerol kinase family enzyme
MQRLLLIANPSASGFTGAGFRGVVETLSGGFEVRVEWPENAQESRRCAAAAASDGVDVVAAMGGDGVVHHVANGVVGTATSLAIIPAGTTNVLARIHHMPSDPVKAAAALRTARPQLVPAAHIAAEGREGESHYAFFSVGLGLDADVVAVAEQRPHSKLFFGPLHYARTVAGQVLGTYLSKPANLRVECGGDRVDAVTVVIQVHDRYSYFGPMPLRLSRTTRGDLTVAAFERIDLLTTGDVITRLALRRSVGNGSRVHVWDDVEKLVVEADPPTLMQADGELLGEQTSVEISPVPFAISILTP